MSEERYTLRDEKVFDWERELTPEKVVEHLRYYEKLRLQKNKEIAKYKAREDRYQRVIGGIQAYLELEANTDLWWDWNE